MNDDTRCFCSGGDVVKMDSQPQHLSVAGGGLSLVVCIGQVLPLNRDLSGLSQHHHFCVIAYFYFFWSLSLPPSLPPPKLVLLKDHKKVFTLDNLGYEAQFGVIHPGGTTVAVGGSVSTRTNRATARSHRCRNHSSFLFSLRIT